MITFRILMFYFKKLRGASLSVNATAFTDGKIGKEVDKTLADEKAVALAKIAATVNCGAWKELLEVAHQKEGTER